MDSVGKDLREITHLHDVVEYLFVYIGLTVLVIGTIGNLINVISFARLAGLKTLTRSLFLLASLIASQLVLTTGLLTRVIRDFSRADPVNQSVDLSKARWMLRTTSDAVSLR
ncbi:unnamed protein product [Rotaria magnacalcarata]|uniref:Uncharacterized protein n=1 Tax=Rotaria magnacalcarata TaxID=392030 RepID=A0A816XVJ8_9BILA|nr:unnamed protein product [Rotaria magnacalcarata]CAF2150738.1 unnamed protein product [Rotaria magnacalcarata]CAF2260195.1 unnamed protein product [Rotaria magnacalcarata]CAF3778557.1 unnamed protein product [Rotaria magnacalcarata]CAF3972961.1 unnamed protein product [Rotaria magnacalcarata]